MNQIIKKNRVLRTQKTQHLPISKAIFVYQYIKKNIVTILLSICIFSISTNWFFAFRGEHNLYHGIVVDYLIPKLYLADGILLGIVVYQFLRKNISMISLCFAGIFMIIQAWSSHFHPATITGSLRIIGLLIAVGFFIQQKAQIQLKTIQQIIVFTAIMQTAISIAQFFLQRELFGYWFFGESTIQSSSSAIARYSYEMIPIPYGTFPHPNVLAGFMVWCLVILSLLKASPTKKIVLYAMTGAVLSLTQSISAFLAFMIYVIWDLSILFRKNSSNHMFFIVQKCFTIFIVLAPIIFSIGVHEFAQKNTTEFSLLRRDQLQTIAIQMITENPWIGIGVSQFSVRTEQYGTVTASYRFLQPVHHVGLLILAEVGVIGIALFTFFLIFVHKMYSAVFFDLFVVLCVFSPILYLDHYLFSLEQGLLMCSILTIFLLNKKENRIK